MTGEVRGQGAAGFVHWERLSTLTGLVFHYNNDTECSIWDLACRQNFGWVGRESYKSCWLTPHPIEFTHTSSGDSHSFTAVRVVEISGNYI